MGFFTWTDARREPSRLRNGDFSMKDKIRYGEYAKLVCPDETEIKEPAYEGYGIFGGHDVFELMAEWNRPYLKTIFWKMSQTETPQLGIELLPVALAYQSGTEADAERATNELINQLLKQEVPTLLCGFPSEWKRLIGITIAHGVDAAGKPAAEYPVKITRSKRRIPYEALLPSYPCQ